MQNLSTKNRETINLLLIHLKDKGGKPALHYYAEYNDDSSLEAIIKIGVDVNAKDATGRTPLVSAIDASSEKAIRVLVKYGAKINIAESNVINPLHQAIRYAPLSTVKFLLEQELDIDINNINFSSSIVRLEGPDYADSEWDYVDIDQPVNTVSALALAVRRKKDATSFIKYLMSKGANINQKNDEEKTILTLVLSNIRTEDHACAIIKCLLEYEPDFEICNTEKDSIKTLLANRKRKLCSCCEPLGNLSDALERELLLSSQICTREKLLLCNSLYLGNYLLPTEIRLKVMEHFLNLFNFDNEQTKEIMTPYAERTVVEEEHKALPHPSYCSGS